MGELPSIDQPDFAVRVREETAGLHVEIRGDASGDAFDALDRLLAVVHRVAMQRAATAVTIDMRDLEFMSSSCFKCLVTWVTDIQALDEAKQYRLTFRSNPAIAWQKRSLRSLSCFAVELITVEQ
jgi:hypothetical protein